MTAALVLSAQGDDSQAAAEIDQQLSKLQAPSAPQCEIVFEGLSEKRYSLVSGHFELDGDVLPFSPKSPGTALYKGTLPPGDHTLDVKLTYNEAQGSGVFEYADYKITVQGEVAIKSEAGLRSRIHVVVVKHDGAPAKKRLTLESRAEAVMLGKIDDSVVPPLPGQNIAAASAPKPAADAGTASDTHAPEETDATGERGHSRHRHGHAGPTGGGEKEDEELADAGAPDAGTLAAGLDAGVDAGAAIAAVQDAGVAAPPAPDNGQLGYWLLGIGVVLGLLALILWRRGAQKKA